MIALIAAYLFGKWSSEETIIAKTVKPTYSGELKEPTFWVNNED